MDVPVELSRIVISEHSPVQTISLREMDGDRTFPIAIGIAEASAIDRRLKRIPVERPMTHDLLGDVIGAMGGTLEKIVVNDLRRLDPSRPDQTFIATLYVRQNGQILEIDARPSDAVALAVGLDTPIFVAEQVFEAVSSPPQLTAEDQVKLLHKRLAWLRHGIERLNRKLEDGEFLASVSQEQIEKCERQIEEMKGEAKVIKQILEKLA